MASARTGLVVLDVLQQVRAGLLLHDVLRGRALARELVGRVQHIQQHPLVHAGRQLVCSGQVEDDLVSTW